MWRAVQDGMQCATGGPRNSPQLNTLRINPARKSGDKKRKVAAGGKAKAMRVEVLATKEFAVAKSGGHVCSIYLTYYPTFQTIKHL